MIYTNQYPKDVSYIKLLLYTIFFGIFGGHYYYVGKYVKGGLMSASFVYLIFCTIFNTQMVNYLENSYFYLPIGIAGFAWIYSMVCVICRKFRVPVTVELPESESALEEKRMQENSIQNVKSEDLLKTTEIANDGLNDESFDCEINKKSNEKDARRRLQKVKNKNAKVRTKEAKTKDVESQIDCEKENLAGENGADEEDK